MNQAKNLIKECRKMCRPLHYDNKLQNPFYPCLKKQIWDNKAKIRG